MTPAFLAVADPPWVREHGGGGRGAQHHYRLSGVRSIADAMRSAPQWRNEGPGLLWLWATAAALVTGDAHALVADLGFRACAAFVWAKVDVIEDEVRCENSRGEITHVCLEEPAFRHPAQPGLGQWTRCEHEHLLICRRGALSVPAPHARHRSVIYAPRGLHSAKPVEAWRIIEETSRNVLGNVRGVEIFARERRDGWDAFGEQLEAAP